MSTPDWAERKACELLTALGAVDEQVGELMITCPTCKGTGIGHIGFDPDWCGECGGPGQVYDYERDDLLRIDAVNKILREAEQRGYERGVEAAAKVADDAREDEEYGHAAFRCVQIAQDIRALVAEDHPNDR